MENDLEFKLNQEIKDPNIFKLDFRGQSYENTKGFNEWKSSIIERYGKNIRLFKCDKDQILFFSLNLPENFKHECPLCKEYICIFCSKRFKHKNSRSCCLNTTIKNLKKNIFSKEEIKIKDYTKHFIFQIHLIPILNILFIMFIICQKFYYNLYTKEAEPNKKTGKYITYSNNFEKKNKKMFRVFTFMNICTSFCIVIGYIYHIILYDIIFILICLFTKFRPLKNIILVQASLLFE